MRIACVSFLAISAALAGSPALAGANDWPGWRGPTGNGISDLKSLPASWNATNNIAWKAPIAGRGHSSPVVWGNRIFLTTDIEGDAIPGKHGPTHMVEGSVFRHPDSRGADHRHTLKVLSFDATTGKQLWDRTVHDGEVYDEIHKFNTYASSTPVTDGKFVYAFFGAEGLYKLDFEGNLIWKRDLGKIDTLGVGFGTSPVLFEDKILLLCDQDEGEKSFLAAISAADGKTAWKVQRHIQDSWATPVIVDVAGKPQLIASGTDFVVAYDPHNGKELWRTAGPGGTIVHSPVYGLGMVFVSVGYPNKKTIAIRLNPAKGENRVAWTYAKGTSYIPSPILYGEYMYLLSETGLLTCLDARTGEPKYEGKRVPTPAFFAAAPVAFDGKLLITSEDGDTYVVKAGPEHEILASNSIGDAVVSSLALAGDSIYIRALNSLYRIRTHEP